MSSSNRSFSNRRTYETEDLERRWLLAPIQLSTFGITNRPGASVSTGQAAYFLADGPPVPTIMVTDGTPSGTRALAGTYSVSSELVNAGGRLFFIGPAAGTPGEALFTPDSSGLLVTRVSQFTNNSPAPNLEYLTEFNGRAYVVGPSLSTGYELFVSDGTSAGTTLAVELSPGTASGVTSAWRAGNELYVVGPRDGGGWRVFRSDGTQAGTNFVCEFASGPMPRGFATLSAGVAFLFGESLWLTDGTPAGTQFVETVASIGSHPAAIVSAGGLGFFMVPGSSSSNAWRTDGTAAGTYPLSVFASQQPEIVRFGSGAYVTGTNGLTRLDGEAPQVLFSGGGNDLYEAYGRLFFSTTDAFAGIVIGQTDGTASGTNLMQVAPNHVAARRFNFVAINGQLIYDCGGVYAVETLALAPLARVTGAVFADFDADGVRDPGEPGETRVVPYFDYDNNGLQESGEAQIPVAGDGTWEVRWARPGDYPIRVRALATFLAQTSPAEPLVIHAAPGAVIDAGMFGIHAANRRVGSVLLDANANDSQDPGESGIGGQTVHFDANADGIVDPGDITVQTQSNGGYVVADLPPSTYLVRVIPANSWFATFPIGRVFVTATLSGSSDTVVPMGVSPVAPMSRVLGSVFLDANRDGLRQTGEPTFVGQFVWIDLDDDGSRDADEPVGTGDFGLASYATGSFNVRAVVPTDWSVTTPAAGVQLTQGSRTYDVLIGLAPALPAGTSLSGVIFDDLDGNGQQGAQEPGRMTTVWLDLNENLIRDAFEPERTSDHIGRFTFNHLRAGDYAVRWLMNWNSVPTTTNDVDALRVSVGAGQQLVGLLLGARPNQPGVSVSGTVFHDLNFNGLRDDGEPVVGARAYVDRDHNGAYSLSLDGTASTTGTFSYSLAPNRYVLTVIPPQGWISTTLISHVVTVLPGQPITGVNFGLVRPLNSVASAAFNVDSPLHSISLSLATPLAHPGNLLTYLRLNVDDGSAAGGASVSYASVALDASSVTLRPNVRFPDGNYRLTFLGTGLAGTSAPTPPDFIFRFHVLSGDATRNRTVDIEDFGVLASRFNLPGTFSQGDFSYNGVTDIDDFGLLAARFNTSLPAAAPGARPGSLPSLPPGSAGHLDLRSPNRFNLESPDDDLLISHR